MRSHPASSIALQPCCHSRGLGLMRPTEGCRSRSCRHTSERSSMTCCCSSTCRRRNSISCSSLVKLRSFKEVCLFRDACADSFSFCSQGKRGHCRATHPQHSIGTHRARQGMECGLGGMGWKNGGRDESPQVVKLEEWTAADQSQARGVADCARC